MAVSSCPPGNYIVDGVCTPCPDGQYQYMYDMPMCFTCIEGKEPNADKTNCVFSALTD